MNWEAITAISTLAATVIILCTAVFAIMQLNEMKRTRKLELLMRVFDDLSSPRARENRLFIYTCLPKEPAQLTSEHFLKIDEVLSGLDRAWILIEENQIEARFIVDTYGEIFLRLWKALYPIVLYERGRRGEYYRKRAEALVELTQKYFLQKKQSTDYTAYHDPNKGGRKVSN